MIKLSDSKKALHLAFDFDKTLAYHKSEWGTTKVGEPIEAMMVFFKQCIKLNIPVTIFTARVSPVHYGPVDIAKSIAMIRKFLLEQGITEDIPITACKDPTFSHIFDDRAYHVMPNTGIIFPLIGF